MDKEEMPEAQQPAATAGGKGRRARLILIGLAVLLLAGAGAAWWLLAASNSQDAAEAQPVDAESLVDVPEVTVNLRTPDGAARMLRVHLMLVPGTAAKEAIEAQLPLVIDALQPFLRELRPEDIAGAAATYRVKEEVLIRSNLALGKGAVRDVLIQDLVQQ